MVRKNLIFLSILSFLLAVANTQAITGVNQAGAMNCCGPEIQPAAAVSMNGEAHAQAGQTPCHCHGSSHLLCLCGTGADPANLPMATSTARVGGVTPLLGPALTILPASSTQPLTRLSQRDSTRLEEPSPQLFIKHQSLLI